MSVALDRATSVDEQVELANSSGKQPVVFIHGLWLLPSSWDRWRDLFEAAGYAAVQPGWPGDPRTVAEAREHPEVLAGKTIGQVARHLEGTVRRLKKKPAVVGHSFGGLLTQMIAGRGVAAASVAIDPAPFRGVLPVPFAALKSAWPVLRNPANRGRAVALTYDQFRYGWSNTLSDAEGRQLHEAFHVPGPGAPVFQAAMANLNPWTEVRVDTRNPDRGPLLIIEGGADHTVPRSIANASFSRQKRNPGITEIKEIPNRGHSLVIDSGWQGVAQTALEFIKRFA
jgi:pimeloyl-ACP methyl ester carboxylesterase